MFTFSENNFIAHLLRFIIAYIFSLACIFFGEYLGGWTGIRLRGPSITKETPGCFISALGYVFILFCVGYFFTFIKFGLLKFVFVFVIAASILYLAIRISRSMSDVTKL